METRVEVGLAAGGQHAGRAGIWPAVGHPHSCGSQGPVLPLRRPSRTPVWSTSVSLRFPSEAVQPEAARGGAGRRRGPYPTASTVLARAMAPKGARVLDMPGITRAA